MPLEEAINALTDATLKLIELRTEAIEATKAAAAPAAKPAGKAKSADKEARDITDSPEDRKPADGTKAKDSDDACTAAIRDYVAVDEGPERDARKAKVKEVLEKVGATKRSEIPAAKEKAFVNTLKKLLAAGNLIADEPEAEGEEEGDDDLLD